MLSELFLQLYETSRLGVSIILALNKLHVKLGITTIIFQTRYNLLPASLTTVLATQTSRIYTVI